MTEPASDPVRVAVDAMGGDHAPEEVVAGVVSSARERPEVSHVLVGPPDVVRRELERHGTPPANIGIEPASQVIGMAEHPVEALRSKPDSSMRVMIRLLKAGRVEAVFSAGNTGAMVAAAMFGLGTLPGVKRPGIAVALPTPAGFSVLIDVGSNPQCKPIHLVQYAIMGAMYARALDPGRQRPVVGLLNIGEEVGKGSPLVRDAHSMLQNCALDFRGNVEAHQIFERQWDVIVCDGFVGNALLKFAEGLSSWLFGYLGNGMTASPEVRARIDEFARRCDYSHYGGAPLLGVPGVVLIGHGRSRANAVSNAVRTAADMVRRRLNETIVEEIKKATWWGRIWERFSTRSGEGGPPK